MKTKLLSFVGFSRSAKNFFIPISQVFLLITVLLLSISLTGCSSKRTIVNNLDEKEANEIIVFLSNRGIDAQKVQAAEAGAGADRAVRWNISVSSDQATRAMALLNQSGLPRRRGQTLLNIFSNVGLVPSDLQDKIRFQQGLAEQIASTIRKIDGVLDADVQLSFPEEDPLNPNVTKGKITASVYVKHSGVLDDPNAHLVTRIKRLISGSINGLEYDNVTVIGDRARYMETTDTFPAVGEQKEYVKLWSVILAKESVTMFRLLFFSFTIGLLLLLLLLLWLGWKFFPLVEKAGGFKHLFTLHPLSIEEKKGEKKEEKKKGENEEEDENEEVEEEDKEEEKEKKEKPKEKK